MAAISHTVCGSDTQIRTSRQKSVVKRKIQCENSGRRMLTLFELFCAASSFLFGVGTAFQHLFFSSTSLGVFQLHVHSVIPCLRPLPTELSAKGLK